MTSNSETTVRYYIIDFAAKPRAYDLYTHMKQYCEAGVRWLREQGRFNECRDLHNWMRSRGGFVRAHTPYFVVLDTDEYKVLMSALRAGQGTPPAYTFARSHGYWFHESGPRQEWGNGVRWSGGR